MKKMSYFKPDFLFEHFSNISIQWLEEQGITHIFSDLDSTLAAHDQLDKGASAQEWISMLKNNKIDLIIISNNSQGRVDRFTSQYEIKGYGKTNKPSTKIIGEIMKDVGAEPSTSLFLGDQIFTDIVCGKRLGMKTALVKPIEPEHEPWNINLKRKLETVIRRAW